MFLFDVVINEWDNFKSFLDTCVILNNLIPYGRDFKFFFKLFK